ncbi:uncharacterized protein LOC143921390 [Arctopsyche grandis]|uniref:uncharacterized protein LOC143921390 n=1 Tax=Arctopsyche grandis TaxID=121162 RepID=UPI00406DA159
MASRSNSITLQDVPPKTRSKKISISSQPAQQGDTAPKSTDQRPQKSSEIILQVTNDRKLRKPNDASVRATVPVIPEDEELDLRVGPKRGGSRYNSNSSINSSIAGSQYRNAGGKYNRQNGGGMINNGYTGSTPSISSSVPVVREQYCYCARWSRLEKILLSMVSILAFMVIVLVITVGILADRKPDFDTIRKQS